jgi:hypothetical protein
MAPTRTILPIVLLVLAHLAAAWTVVFRFRWDGLALALILHFLIGCLGISIARRVVSPRRLHRHQPVPARRAGGGLLQ